MESFQHYKLKISEGFTRHMAGVFIVLALLWGWQIDGVLPDRFDIIGAAVSLVGVFIIMYGPRV